MFIRNAIRLSFPWSCFGCNNRQIVVEYDILKSNQSGTYVPGTSYKVYSQDFQTVFGDKDIYGYNEVMTNILYLVVICIFF